MALIDKLNAIGDAIRAKTGKTNKMTLDEMPTVIERIVGEWEFWIGVMFGGDVYGLKTPGHITLPDGLTQIPENAYNSAVSKYHLVNIKIPEGVTIIKDSAFNGCTSLKEATLPQSLEQIDGDAFINCSKLALTSLPSGLKNIGGSAFAYCSNVQADKLPNNIESVGSYAFYGAGSSGFPATMPASLKHIGNYAFGSVKLYEISFWSKPDYISPTAFAGCPTISIYVPWAEGEVANAPWGATGARIYYNWRN